MKIFSRDISVINPSDSIQEFYILKNFPISMSCVNTAAELDLFSNMRWGVSTSGTVELMDLLDPNLIYKNYHSPGTIGKIWKDHHYRFFDFINQDSYNNVLEIGGASGLLAENFCSTARRFNWTIVEPGGYRNLKDDRVNFVQDFFETWTTNQKFDTLVHSHVFEHTYDPIKFLIKANQLLVNGGFHYISIPNMYYWLGNGFTNTLSFEHTFYVDKTVLEYLLRKTGFEAVEWSINDHSIFVKARKTDCILNKEVDFQYIGELFNSYIKNQQDDVESINQRLNNREFYLFGAHIFAQSLFNFGLDQSKVINLLDNDPNKQNKRLYGTNCWVKSPRCLEGLDCPIVVLRSGSYTEEIKESILKINSTVIFI
jgi:2-polyprenyl-3-methyl-5-hydroxy-6-metoxy-1,4-benzoquinol methylase